VRHILAAVTSDPKEQLPEQTADLFGEPSTSEPGQEAGTAPASAADSEGSDETILPPPPQAGDVRGRTSIPDLFRMTSQDVLKYVFSHSLDVAELIVVVFCYLVFLFLGSRKLKARVHRTFPGDRSTRLVAIGDGITESMERFMGGENANGRGHGGVCRGHHARIRSRPLDALGVSAGELECHYRTCRDSDRHREEESAPWALETAEPPACQARTQARCNRRYRLGLYGVFSRQADRNSQHREADYHQRRHRKDRQDRRPPAQILRNR
jgi:hypothetical protein